LRGYALVCLAAAFVASACGSSPTPTQPTQTPPTSAAATRIIGLTGNLGFGNIIVGSHASASMTITNSGTSTLTVTGLSITSSLTSVYTANWTSGTIPAGASQPVTIQFSPTSAQAYNGSITVNGDQTSGVNSISVAGAGVNPVSCGYTLSIGTTIDGYPNGGSFPVTVTAPSGCSWSASTTAAWIHMPAQTSGNGNGSVTFTVDANAGTPRTGTVNIAGNIVTFNQTGTAAPTPVPTPGPTPAPVPTPAPSSVLYVFGGPSYTQYLGSFTCVFCTEFAPDSINNLFGIYGSQFSATSIRNQFSIYGNQFSTYSACDQFATNPPRVFNSNGTIYYGELTLNQFRVAAIKSSTIAAWLVGDVCRH
jgi:hypothetical protein